MKSEYFFILLFSELTLSACSNILIVFNTPSKSHSILGNKLSEGLVKRGHNVTFLSPHKIDVNWNNYTFIHLKTLEEFRAEFAKKNARPGVGKFTFFKSMINLIRGVNELFWEEPEVQKIIREKPKYDALITFCFFSDSVLGLAHHLGVPSILFSGIGSSSLANKYMANPNVVYASNPMISKPTDSFFGRLFAVTANVFIDIINEYVFDHFQAELLQKYLPESPPVRELQKNCALMLLNSHFSIEPAKPLVPNMILIGGYHIQDSKELPGDIQQFLDSAKEGVILFSLGSNKQVASIEEEKRKAIFKVLGEMEPMKVLFKSEIDHANLTDNILVRKWIPQADILGHPNVRVFISHGGMGGNIESVYHGVPILGIPFAADQTLNMQTAKDAGYAEFLTNEELSEANLRKSLKAVIENPKYRNNVKLRSELLRNQPVKPMDNAAFWIEHVIKHGGGSHLRNAGMDLTWYQLYMIDIYILYTVFLTLIIFINYYILKLLIKNTIKICTTKALKIKTA